MKKLILVFCLLGLTGCSSREQKVSVDGYNGEIVLRVDVKRDQIAGIEIISHQETKEIVEKP